MRERMMPGKLLFALSLLLATQGIGAAPPPAVGALPVHDKAIVWTRGHTKVDVHYFTTGIPAIDKLTGYPFQGEDIDPLKQRDIAEDDARPQLNAGYEITRNDSEMFSARFDSNEYTGGAHGRSEVHTFTFLMPDAHLVFLAELVDGRRGMEKISELALARTIADFKEKGSAIGERRMDEIRGALDPDYLDAKPFIWKSQELVLSLGDYEIGGYNSGRDIHIPLSDLEDVIRADSRKPMPSFACEDARTKIERALCANVDLARLDREVTRRYRGELMLTRSDITRPQKYPATDPGQQQKNIQSATAAQERLNRKIADQRTWLAKRNADCASGNPVCLRDSYGTRLKQF